MKDLTFFLGANTYSGFCSLYEEYLQTEAGASVWILKGGAGCGKSGFMRTVGQRAANAGYVVHRILCSGDPSSLDGIHIPDLGVIMLDGTAPHVLEPPLVGSRGFYLDLSRFYRPGAPDLGEQEAVYREHYRRAYRWLSAAGNVEETLILPAETEAVIRRKAVSLITRELRLKSKTPGRRRRFFADAFTCEGMVALSDTHAALAEQRIGLQGICGCEHAFLSAAAEAALARGWDVVQCPSPLRLDRLSHLFIPECGLGICTGSGDRYIHLDKIVYHSADREESARIREAESMRLALLARARKELALAKLHHDLLEKSVNPYVDFSAVYESAEAFADDLLRAAPAPAARG